MTKKEFEFLLKQGEGLMLEFKENFDSKNITKEMCAFANTQGGKIFIGVDDTGKIKGINLTNKIKSELQDAARKCDPPINIQFETFDNILILDVKEGLNKPYRCSTGFFLRQASSSQKLSTDEIRDFFNKEGKILFDEAINKEFNFRNGFVKSKFEMFLQTAKISKVLKDIDILKNIGILTPQKEFKNAGVLFFCDNIEKFFRHAIITCVMYKGINKYKVIDRKDFTEDILSNYNNTMAFLFRNLRLEYKINTVGPRKEILEIPEEALREAVINAIAHRDYNEKRANIQIDIFDDRVEISNPGGLVSAMKKEDFGKKSFPRNPLLFSLLKSVNLVEKIGSGIERIKQSMKQSGLPAPKFESTSFFTVILPRPLTPQVAPQVAPQVILTELETKILKEIKKYPQISRKKIAENLMIKSDTVKEYIARLKKKNVIKRIGKTSNGFWEILK
jgi:ATP-dependent DNA helicase RecG